MCIFTIVFFLLQTRPLINRVRNRLLKLPLEQNLCVDEQMIPFKGQLSIKQYIQNKPTKWGLKVFLLCGESGIPYDFILYQGSTTEISAEMLNEFGFGASIVLHLSQRIPASAQGHTMFFDNFFTTYPLLEVLYDRNICAAGTIRINRFGQTSLIADKDMRKLGRGAMQEIRSMEKPYIRVVKWFDNKQVHLASNFAALEPTDWVRRWDKKSKQYVDVDRPDVIRRYNKSMGGVDHFDQMLQYYRIFIKSKKWTMRVAMHFIDFAVVASWMEYCADCKRFGVQSVGLLTFRKKLARQLMAEKPDIIIRTPGRPRKRKNLQEECESPSPPPKKYHIAPEKKLVTDRIDHFPRFDARRDGSRCSYVMTNGKACGLKTHTYCNKCKTYLCLTREKDGTERNHFALHHGYDL